MKKILVPVTMLVVAALVGLGVAAVTAGGSVSQGATGEAGSVVELVGEAGSAAQPEHRYFSISNSIKDARRACERSGQSDVVYGAGYEAWYYGLTSGERAHWQSVFEACQATHSARFPADFHQVSEVEFYGG